MSKQNWIKFITELGHIGGYRYDESISDYRIRLFSSVPKTHYYSALNDIGEHFTQTIEPQLKLCQEDKHQ